MKHIRILLVFILWQSSTFAFAQSDTVEVRQIDSTSTMDEEDEESDTSVLRRIDETEWEKIKQDKAFIYEHNKLKKKKEKQVELPQFNIISFFTSGIFKAILFILVGILVLVIFYHLVLKNENLFGKQKLKKTTPENLDYEEIETFTEWDKALQMALAENNYRVAVRILFLQTLQQLDDKNYIRFEKEKTNWHYVTQLKGTAYEANFSMLTSYFDYVWYGEFKIDHALYNEIETRFSIFQKEIV
ncbi:MAG: hypothetical protein IPI46_03790 [Bacteroidetes bacterium]|nr:hypothetical protein [Bacteroidota bacterium]